MSAGPPLARGWLEPFPMHFRRTIPRFFSFILLAGAARIAVAAASDAPPVDCFSALTEAASAPGAWDPAKPLVFRYPEGRKGWHRIGFRDFHDGTRDWRPWNGLRMEIEVPAGRVLDLKARIAIPPTSSRQNFLPASEARIRVTGGGWKPVLLPWSAFDFEKGRPAFLEFISELSLTGSFSDGKPGAVGLRNVGLARDPDLFLTAERRGASVGPGGTAVYQITAGNCTAVRREVTLTLAKEGWERMEATVEPAHLTLEPAGTARTIVTVRLPAEGIPEGGHERQRLVATSDDIPPETIELITARDVARPHIQHTAQGWRDVRDKVAKYPWAKQQAEELEKTARAWKVPEPALPPNNISEGHVYVFRNEEFTRLIQTAHAWQITRDPEFAGKVALFLKRLADPVHGYPSTFAATHLGEPQEGGNFQWIAIAYDAILDAGVLTTEDRAAIERMFRIYLDVIETPLGTGNVGNWNVAAATSGLFCALAIGDLAAAERYIHGTCGFTDLLTKGVMDDGWWWECSTSYNFWVAAELTQCALATRPWGIDLLHRGFPVSHSPRTIIMPWGLDPILGMSFDKWGPVHRNTRSIKQLWDAVPPAADYRGVTFGINDGTDQAVGSRFETGYFAFRDPAYVPTLRIAAKRDLIYGVPELPEVTAKPYLDTTLAENLGIAMLRSQNPARPPRERINAGFKIGTQGGFHGHFDRVSLNSLSRYGRNFWNPETIWWGYANYLYKFYVQTSVAHNMVVVDQKQQEAVPSVQRLFHAGELMQASVQETNARWCDPPYGGMEYDAMDSGGEVKGFDAGMRRNRQSVPLVTDRRQAQLGPFSERVLQRRLGLVTDDYVLIADFLRGSETHVFDQLFQMRGFQGIESARVETLRHDAQFNPDPRSAAQFITDCQWTRTSSPSISRFLIQNGEGDGKHANEPGVLRIDAHQLWPIEQELMIAQPPENLGGQQWVKYQLSGDGKPLAQGETGAWILGAVDLDVPVSDVSELTLSLQSDGFGKTDNLFLTNARIVDAAGRETPVDAGGLENIRPVTQPGKDYQGGPIKLAGIARDQAIAVQPADVNQAARLRMPLDGRGALRFKATLGADYPHGDEAMRRKVFSSRSRGTSARFLTILEPYEGKPVIRSAKALDADRLRVELIDGRTQEIEIRNLEGGGEDITITLTETTGDGRKRVESTAGR